MRLARFLFGALFVATFGPATASAAGHDVTDAQGFKTQIASDRPARIVTLMPALGEIAADLAGDQAATRLIGVSAFTDYPTVLKGAKVIASATQINLEAVVGLRPDLVLAAADGNPKDQVQHLRELGLPVVVVNSASFHDLEESITITAQAMGENERGKVILARLLAGISQIQGHARTRGLHPSVLFELGEDPLIVVGHASFLNEAIELVGARNVFGDLPTGYPRPSLEEAVKRDPDAIVIPADSADSESALKAVAYWDRFPKLKAVATKHVRAFPSGTLLRPTPRILESLVALERAIYGKAPR